MTDPVEALRSLFIARCAVDLAGLRRAKAEGDAAELARLVHTLAGSAGSFGFPEISRLALILDEGYRAGATVPELALNELIAVLDRMKVGQESAVGQRTIRAASPNVA